MPVSFGVAGRLYLPELPEQLLQIDVKLLEAVADRSSPLLVGLRASRRNP